MLPALLLAACGSPPPPTPPDLGQWVWSAADVPVLAAVRADRPVVAGIHVATVRFRDGAFDNDLALPPTAAPPPIAAVIRLDDDVHAAWDTLGDDAVAAGLDAALARVLALVDRRGVPVTEVQLDYDCPVRLLPRWAAVLGRLRAGALAGRAVWVTSLVAHLRDPRYGDLFRARVDGHVLQVFDTGDDAVDAAAVGDDAVAAGIPYRLGVGAFEREHTAHDAWFAVSGIACRAPLCDTVWVFPAGRPYRDHLRGPP